MYIGIADQQKLWKQDRDDSRNSLVYNLPTYLFSLCNFWRRSIKGGCMLNAVIPTLFSYSLLFCYHLVNVFCVIIIFCIFHYYPLTFRYCSSVWISFFDDE